MNGIIDISCILRELKIDRNVLNLEADFQFALAQEIKELYQSQVDVRLEYAINLDEGTNNFIDIVVFSTRNTLFPQS